MLEDVLARGFEALVLTNAMKPMRKLRPQLLALLARYGDRLTHPRLARPLRAGRCTRRSAARGAGQPTIDGLVWLARNGFAVARRRPALLRRDRGASCAPAIARLFAELGVPIDAARSGQAGAVSRDGRQRRRAGDHHGLLGHPAQVARRRDVRLGPHGGEAQGRRDARRASPARCCPTIRSSSSAARWPEARRGAAQPSVLRHVLRAGRRGLQP